MRRRVAVLGAGTDGVAAAVELLGAGVEVVVLPAGGQPEDAEAAGALGGRLRAGVAVREVGHSPQGVLLETSAGTDVVEALVIALALPELYELTITPPLPFERRTALHHLVTGRAAPGDLDVVRAPHHRLFFAVRGEDEPPSGARAAREALEALGVRG